MLEEHPDKLSSMDKLTVYFYQLYRFQEAMKGDDISHKLFSMNKYALSLHKQGDYTLAEDIYRKILLLLESAPGKDRLDTISTMNNLANVLQLQAKFDEAEIIRRKTLQL